MIALIFNFVVAIIVSLLTKELMKDTRGGEVAVEAPRQIEETSIK